MDSLSHFELGTRAALIAGAWTFGVVGLIWIEILRLRRRQGREKQIADDVIKRWRPILSQASVGIRIGPLPTLHRHENDAFLKLWLHLQSSLRGEAGSALSDLARELHCDHLTLRMLERGNRGDKLLATLVAGHLGLTDALPMLTSQIACKDSILSLQALHSVLRIAPERSAVLVQRCVQRRDWPVSQLLPSLRACSPWILAPLVATLDHSDETELLRTLQLLSGLRLSLEISLQRRLLSMASALLLSEALKLVDQPLLRGSVRAHLQHSDPRVRAAATVALARLGSTADLPDLSERLADTHWIVRNSAARAIATMPGGGTLALRHAGDTCGDAAGKSMADHVLAEIRFAS